MVWLTYYYGCNHQSVVAPSGERLQGKGRYGVFAVIHTWAFHDGVLYKSMHLYLLVWYFVRIVRKLFFVHNSI